MVPGSINKGAKANTLILEIGAVNNAKNPNTPPIKRVKDVDFLCNQLFIKCQILLAITIALISPNKIVYIQGCSSLIIAILVSKVGRVNLSSLLQQ